MSRGPRTRFNDKIDWLDAYVANQNVLYIGCVDEDEDNFRKHADMQVRLQKSAATITGVYATDAQVRELTAAGLRAVPANFEEMDLNTEFDVIAAPDNIEHLPNPGYFLRSLARHMAPQGRLLVSTPNPASLVRILELLAYGRSKTNREHTAWYSGQVIEQLAARYGLALEDEVFIDDMYRYHDLARRGRQLGFGMRVATRCTVSANRVLCRLLPQLSETFGFVLVKARQ